MNFSFANTAIKTPAKTNTWIIGTSIVFLLAWVKSLIHTNDINNWMLENILVFGFVGVLIATYKRFQFSDASYLLIGLYLTLHVHGSMFTYAESPLGYWMADFFDWERNNFDRLVHFSFGFLLAYPMRELFLRGLKTKSWVAWVLPAEIVMSLSGLYEIVEWAVADFFFPEQGVAYLGTQGDVWDAQKDMALAFAGSVLVLLLVFSLKKILKK